MKTRTLEDVDIDLVNLARIAGHFRYGSEQWRITWERIDEILEERGRFTDDGDMLNPEVN
jgi:hypothetical protein